MYSPLATKYFIKCSGNNKTDMMLRKENGVKLHKDMEIEIKFLKTFIRFKVIDLNEKYNESNPIQNNG